MWLLVHMRMLLTCLRVGVLAVAPCTMVHIGHIRQMLLYLNLPQLRAVQQD
jgi:hypothetical protein